MRFPIDAKLKDGTRIDLVLARGQDFGPLQHLYRIIVEEGTSYPHDRPPADSELEEYWFRGKTTVAAYLRDGARHSGREPVLAGSGREGAMAPGAGGLRWGRSTDDGRGFLP